MGGWLERFRERLNECSDVALDCQAWLWGMATFLLWVIVIASQCGCTQSQLRSINRGVVTAGDCALHTSMACASQALGACNEHREGSGSGYGNLGGCLVREAASCTGRGIGRCLYAGLVRAVGGGPVVAGGIGCTGEESLETVESCVRDTTIESEAEAVGAVASCYLVVCAPHAAATRED